MMNIGAMSKMIYFIVLISLPLTIAHDYSIVIPEKSATHQRILSLPRSSELITNFQSNFGLINNNTDLILTKPIDRDRWCAQGICACDHCSFILEILSLNNRDEPVFSTLNITISDLNDHACLFLDIQSNISLSESIQIGHRFPIARAIDFDSGSNAQLTFELIQGQDYFQLNIVPLSSNEYAIYGIVKRSFDRTTIHKYELIVEARDHGLPEPKTNRTKVTIWILDENNNAPKFDQSEYSIQDLPENTPVGTPLLTIHATDADTGLNGLVHYSFITPPPLSATESSTSPASFPFALDRTTGVVTLRSPLDYESVRSYRFLIRASDSGTPQALFTDTWLSISIKDVNDCPVDILFVAHRRFRFVNHTLFIPEDIPSTNTTLGYLRLTDRDSIPMPLSASLISPMNSDQQFQLIPSGQINSYTLMFTSGEFDRETKPEIYLRFVATDTQLTSNYDLTIHLLDVNDNPSRFPSDPLLFYVEELADYHMVDQPPRDYQITIGYLNATDPDEGENARSVYELENHPLVKVDGNTGRLWLVQPLDREQVQKIELQAKAINIAPPKWVTNVQIIIHVLDVNDNVPRCALSMYQKSFLENVSIETPLLSIEGIDPDFGVNGTIRYSLTSNSSWPFVIDSVSGKIFTRQSFDYEVLPHNYQLMIDLEDQGSPISLRKNGACQVQIAIEDVNDNRPELVDDRQTQLFVDIRTPSGEIVLLKAKDADSGDNGRVRFVLQAVESSISVDEQELNKQQRFQFRKESITMKDENESTKPMFILTEDGSLQITRSVDQISLFKLRVLLEDYGTPPHRSLLTITVAVGDLSSPTLSTFEGVRIAIAQIERARSRPSYIGLILGLTVLIITFVLLICVTIVCILLRQHRRRHQAAMASRNKLLCSSSQQLTSSGSTATTNTTSSFTSSSTEHQVLHQQQISTIIRPPQWDEKSLASSPGLDRHSSASYAADTSSPESRTYKILHIPPDNEHYLQHYLQQRGSLGSDHGYHGSYETGSSSSSPHQIPPPLPLRRSYMVNQLPHFVTRCKSVSGGFLVEMNVDGSDEEPR